MNNANGSMNRQFKLSYLHFEQGEEVFVINQIRYYPSSLSGEWIGGGVLTQPDEFLSEIYLG